MKNKKKKIVNVTKLSICLALIAFLIAILSSGLLPQGSFFPIIVLVLIFLIVLIMDHFFS